MPHERGGHKVLTRNITQSRLKSNVGHEVFTGSITSQTVLLPSPSAFACSFFVICCNESHELLFSVFHVFQLLTYQICISFWIFLPACNFFFLFCFRKEVQVYHCFIIRPSWSILPDFVVKIDYLCIVIPYTEYLVPFANGCNYNMRKCYNEILIYCAWTMRLKVVA